MRYRKILALALSAMPLATWLLGASGAVNASETVVLRGCLSLDGEFRKISGKKTCVQVPWRSNVST